jgi:hypothetical protein
VAGGARAHCRRPQPGALQPPRAARAPPLRLTRPRPPRPARRRSSRIVRSVMPPVLVVSAIATGERGRAAAAPGRFGARPPPHSFLPPAHSSAPPHAPFPMPSFLSSFSTLPPPPPP